MASRSALKELSRVENLRKAWLFISDAKKARHRNSSGVDNESINRFSDRADEFLQSMSRQLRSPTGFQFSHLKPYIESKSDGKDRVICVPTVRDRIVQRAVLDYLEDAPKYNIETAVSYGFVRRKGVRKAVSRTLQERVKHPWAYKTDISAFFDTIDRDLIKKKVRSRIRLRSLWPIFDAIINSEARPSSKSQAKRMTANGIRRGKGLRQGMPVSPLLANLFLENFDKSVIDNGWSMVRYADDLIFLADSKEACERIHRFCKIALSEIGLAIHELGTAKTSIVNPSDPVEFLGVAIVRSDRKYSAVITDGQILKKKTELLGLASLKNLAEQKITISKLLRTLDGKIAGWNDAYNFCSNHSQFADKLRDYRNNVLQKLFVNELGMNSLNAESRRFLEIR